jgi:hypothetical protein
MKRCALILFTPCALVIADGAAMSTEALQSRYREIREKMSLAPEASARSSAKAVASEFGTVVAYGLKMESDDVSVTLDVSSGRPLIIEVETDAGSETVSGSPFRDADDALDAAEAIVCSFGWPIGTNTHLIHKEFDADRQLWRFSWQKHLSGYPFPEETVSLSINATNRQLSAFRSYLTDRACPTVPKLPATQARRIAETRAAELAPKLMGQNYRVRKVAEKGLQIVYPNTRYSTDDGNVVSGKPAPSPRLVYWFDIEFQYDGTSMLHRVSAPISIWVDALSGSLAGGL